MLRIEVKNLRVRKNVLVGDLEYLPYWLFVDNYVFDEGDVITDGEECYVEMTEDKFFLITYGF